MSASRAPAAGPPCYTLFVCHCEADGREGLRRALGGGFDPTLLDGMLPGIDGFEICNRVRAADPEQAIILLTAKTSAEDIIRGQTLGGPPDLEARRRPSARLRRGPARAALRLAQRRRSRDNGADSCNQEKGT